MKRALIGGLTVIIFLLIGGSYFYLNKALNRSPAILIIDGEDVNIDEFRFMLERQRASVYDYFFNRYGVSDSNEFWNTPIKGELPLQKAKEQTINEILKAHTIRSLAKKLGVIKDSSYSALLQAMKDENNKRKTASEKGEIVYGPLHFDELMFYEYWNSNVISEIKKKMELRNWQISDQDLSAYYNTIKARYFKRDGDLTTEIVSFRYTDADSEPSEKLKETAEEALERIKSSDGANKFVEEAERLKKQYPTQVNYSKTVFYQSGEKANIQQYGDIWVVTRQLNVGQTSKVMDWQGALVVVKLLNRSNDGYQKYDEVQDSVKQLYVNKLFDDELEKEVKNRVWIVNQKYLDQIEM